MFTYPSEDGVIPAFFTQLMRLCTLENIKELHNIGAWIKTKTIEIESLKLHFTAPELFEEEDRPTPYQMAIYLCECEALQMLEIMLEYAQLTRDGQLSPLNVHRLEVLSKLPILPIAQHDLMLRAIRMYCVIAAKIFLLPKLEYSHSAANANYALHESLRIYKLLIQYQDDYRSYGLIEADNAGQEYFRSIAAGMRSMFVSETATSAPSTFAIALSSIFGVKLLSLRNYIMQEEKTSQKKSTHEQQAIRIRLRHVDAMLRKLSLIGVDDMRSVYNSHAKMHSEFGSGIDIASYYVGLDKKSPVTVVADVSEEQYLLIDKFEHMLGSLNLLKDSKQLSLATLRQTALREIGNLHFMTHWLNLFRANVNYINIELREVHSQSVKLITSLTIGLAHLVDPNHQEFPVTPLEVDMVYDSITMQVLTNLFFGNLRSSDCMSCIITSMLDNKLKKALLEHKKSVEYRQHVMEDAKTDIHAILLLLHTRSKELPPNNLLMTIQFALDYFCLTLMQCQTLEEINIVSSLVVDTSLMDLLEKYPTNELYKFTYSYLIWLKVKKIDHHKMNVNHFGLLEDESIDKLFQLAGMAINNLGKHAIRVNTKVKNFFLTHARMLLEYIHAVRPAEQAKDAAQFIKMLDGYLANLEVKALKTLEMFAPSARDPRPVKFVSEADKNASYRIGTLVESQKSGKKSKKDKKKVGVAPAKVVTAPKVETSVKLEAPAPRQEMKRLTIESSVVEMLETHKALHKVLEYIKKHYNRSYNLTEQGYALVRHAQCIAKLQEEKPEKVKSELADVVARAEKLWSQVEVYAPTTYVTLKKKYEAALKHIMKAAEPVKKMEAAAKETPTKQMASKQVPAKQVATKSPATLASAAKTSKNDATLFRAATKNTKTPPQAQPKIAPAKATVGVKNNAKPAVKAPIHSPWKVMVKPVIKRDMTIETLDVHLTPPHNYYGAMLDETVLPVVPNTVEQTLIDILYDAGMEPYCHGGRVVYAALIPNAVIKSDPDLDFGCYVTDPKLLYQCLVDNQEKLGIKNVKTDIRPDDNNKVYVVTSQHKHANGEPELLEIAYNVIANKEEIADKFKQKSLGYGTNATAYCRAKDMRLIYPSDQHRAFIKNKQLSVAWDKCDAEKYPGMIFDINTYFKAFPQRQLDTVDRLAKLAFYGCVLSIDSCITEAIINNHAALCSAMTTFNRFDKLFLQGYGRRSFLIMQQLKMNVALFPVLRPHQIQNFYQACILLDSKVAKCDARLTLKETINFRTQFIARALYESFVASGNPKALAVNSYMLYQACIQFMKYTRVFVSHEYIDFTSLQDDWEKRLKGVVIEAEPGDALVMENCKIPESMCCPITNELFIDPVLCELDDRTYERRAILESLTRYRSSPITRAPLKPGQNPEDVLRPNRVVIDLVDEGVVVDPRPQLERRSGKTL